MNTPTATLQDVNGKMLRYGTVIDDDGQAGEVINKAWVCADGTMLPPASDPNHIVFDTVLKRYGIMFPETVREERDSFIVRVQFADGDHCFRRADLLTEVKTANEYPQHFGSRH